MNIPLGRELLTEADHIEDPVLKIIERFKNHPSVVIIFEIHKENNAFSFKHVFVDEITREIKSLDGKKPSQDTNISLKVMKKNNDKFADFLFLNLNDCITSSVYPSSLRNANISSAHTID